ncbi:MAG: short-chain dehydrogenase [Bacteroidetes bacterium 13_1_20CM_4_60_6]|nr:MAG: short-chain dehydrogenase [Bacteroidetes bacterium 13_1_20CM_4_60_6]
MDLQLKNKVILITGGAKGIGAAITRACAREGAVPVIVDKDKTAGEQLRRELQTPGAPCGFICTDLSLVANCAAAVETTLRDFERLDALVNNAGMNDKTGLEHGSPERFLRSLELNLHHYYNLAHYALPALKRSQGSILNIASKVALTGQGGTSGYAAAKGAILSLTREWAAELLPCGIRVNAVLPAEVMTPLYQNWLDTFPDPHEKLKQVTAKIPLGKRMTETDEIAAMALFLISVQASHITGQHVSVDGGYVHLDRALS